MREIPISQEISQCTTLKKSYELCSEIQKMVLTLLKVDRRTIPREELSKFKGRLSLYSKLYNQAYDKYFLLRLTCLEEKPYVKVPEEFSELIKEYNWKKITGNCLPLKKTNYLKTELNIEKIMAQKSFFYRNDPQVVVDTQSLDLEVFLEKYSSQTKQEVLEKVWKENQKTIEQKVKDRVGVEKETEPLVAIAGKGKTSKKKETTTVDGVKIIAGKTVYEAPESEIKQAFKEIEKPKSTQKEVEKSESEPTKKLEEEVVEDSKLIKFKTLSTEERKKIIQEFLDAGVISVAKMRKSLISKNYLVSYDDIYSPYEAMKKVSK